MVRKDEHNTQGVAMDFVRTPDHRFDNLPDWPYAPHYTEVRATPDDPTLLRIAHVDEGPRDAKETVLLMHGEPSWSYLSTEK